MTTLAELATRHRDRIAPAAAPQTWAAAMAGVIEAEYDRVFADEAIVECNRLASLAPVPAELRDLVADWSEILPLLKPAHDANCSTASDAPAYLKSLLTKMGAAADRAA